VHNKRVPARAGLRCHLLSLDLAIIYCHNDYQTCPYG